MKLRLEILGDFRNPELVETVLKLWIKTCGALQEFIILKSFKAKKGKRIIYCKCVKNQQ